jgi:translation machinery-associated protein 16
MPPERDALSLPELHELVRDVWLGRHDEALEQERAARRKGRPKSTKEANLEEIKLVENEEYRTGMGVSRCFSLQKKLCLVLNEITEVIDLTHPANVTLLRQWDQAELPFIQLLRFVRISSSNPEIALVSRPGKHVTLVPPKPKLSEPTDDESVPELLPAPIEDSEMTLDA